MPPWFDELADVEDPRQEELQLFVEEVREFLRFVLDDGESFGFLWEDDPELRQLAVETFEHDVSEGTVLLSQAVPQVSPQHLASHGLLGRPLRFKFKVLASVARGWARVRGQFSVREWFKRICDAIDAILDSLIQVAAGAGGVIKEFKDALSALVKTT